MNPEDPRNILWRAHSNAGADSDAAEMVPDCENKSDKRETPQGAGPTDFMY